MELFLKIVLEKKFENKITISDYSRDCFIYDFKFENTTENGVIVEPPLSLNLNHDLQFEIYLHYIRTTLNLKQYSKENEDFISSTLKLLIGSGKKYEFSFYIVVLLVCLECNVKFIKRLLIIFKEDKIMDIGKLSENKINEINNILEEIKANPNLVLDAINDDWKDEYGKKLFEIILFFTYNFKKEEIQKILTSEKMKPYLNKILIEDNNLFKNIKLTKEQINNLIYESKDLDEINKALMYCNGVLDLIETISEYSNFHKIINIYKAIKSKIKPSIDIESITSPKIDDNIKEICEKFKSLFNKQKVNLDYIFINFKYSLLEKYIGFYEKINIDNLFYIKDLIKFLKSNNNIVDILEADVNIKIHDTGILLSKKHKLKNIEILNFIQKDVYYNDSKYTKTIYRCFDILDGLDIKSFNDEFFSEWKKIDWEKIFGEQYLNGFYIKIVEFIDNLQDFNVLFKLFDISTDKNKPYYNYYSLNAMQKKFVELIKSCDPKNCPIYDDDLVKLLFYSDQSKANIKDFLTIYLQKSLSLKRINEIYIKFLSNYRDLISSDTKLIIIDFFTKNPSNSNPDSLLFFMKKCPEISRNILENINNYNIQKEDFLKFEENDRLKLFKGLLYKKYIEKEEYQNTDYVQNAMMNIKELQNDILTGNILYKEISPFYNEKNNKIYSRLDIIALNSNEDYKKYKTKINNYYSSITIILKDLQLILEDLLIFYYNEEREKINKLKDIIKTIKNGVLNYYEKHYANNEVIKELLKNKEKAKKRAVYKKSAFFLTIFKNNSLKYKNDSDSDDCIKESEEKFLKLKNIFNKKGFQDLIKDKDILKDFLDTIKVKEEEEIMKEIDILIDIFGIDINKDIYNKKKITKNLIILSKKEDLYNIANAISIIIEKFGVIKGDLWKLVNKIIKDIENIDEEKKIKNYIKSLKKKNVDLEILNDEKIKNNYLKLLMKLKEKPEALDFIIKINRYDCLYLQEILEEMDNYILLNSNDILDLAKCVEFRKKLGNEDTFKTRKDFEIINFFQNEVIKKENNDI